jgi:hypothetical protein
LEFRKEVGFVRTWVTRRKRNEAWDLTVCGLATLYILGPAMIRSLGDRAEQYAKPPEGGPEPEAPAPPAVLAAPRRPRRRSNWVTGGRRLVQPSGFLSRLTSLAGERLVDVALSIEDSLHRNCVGGAEHCWGV